MRLRQLMLVFVAAFVPYLVAQDLDSARRKYNRTDYDGALADLSGRTGAPALALRGRCQYMLDDFKAAVETFEQAIALEPGNSVSWNWLGKAFGRRAESASAFAAPGLAVKARKAFEKAVELDPRNTEAMSDLLEYYLAAPGFLGGGVGKAQALAGRIAAADPVEGHWARAQVARKQKRPDAAEQELRQAMELAPREIGRVLDLARFLARQQRYAESDELFRAAARLGPGHPKWLYARAETLIQSKRNLPEARDLLRRYLAADLTPDDPKRREAEALLREAGA
jgi:tetratricopeptide (TPR) repeat protein